VSSAILYLAIVAIWACVLVPRWLRRPHEQPSDQETAFESYDSGQVETADTGEPADGDPYAEAPDFATLREQGAPTYGDPVAWEEPAAPDWAVTDGPVSDGVEGPVETGYSVTATYSAEVTYSAEATYSEEATYSAETSADEAGQDAAYYDAPVHGGAVPHRGHVNHGGPPDGRRYPQVPQSSPGPSPHVVQARRRTLTMVLLITVAVMGFAFVGLTPWWTALPPFLMLGGYLLLLREAARVDAEHAYSWAEAEADRAARRAELARERARQAHTVSQPQPTAEIITLSTLASPADDQPYDQYADAEIRAVGD
jgi:hypothetical protein